jgi:alpha-aminoadipic semialdehyde synthase
LAKAETDSSSRELGPHITMPRSVGEQALSPFDYFVYLLAQKLQYQPGERDVVVLHHELALSDGEVLSSSLEVVGDAVGAVGGHSAMAKTVGWPIALGGCLLLDGGVTDRGVLRPTARAVREPLLLALAELGVGMDERRGRGDLGGRMMRDLIRKCG